MIARAHDSEQEYDISSPQEKVYQILFLQSMKFRRQLIHLQNLFQDPNTIKKQAIERIIAYVGGKYHLLDTVLGHDDMDVAALIEYMQDCATLLNEANEQLRDALQDPLYQEDRDGLQARYATQLDEFLPRYLGTIHMYRSIRTLYQEYGLDLSDEHEGIARVDELAYCIPDIVSVTSRIGLPLAAYKYEKYLAAYDKNVATPFENRRSLQ